MMGGDHNRVKYLKEEVRILMDKEEAMWRLLSSIQWLQGGDQNSRFFFTQKPLNVYDEA